MMENFLGYLIVLLISVTVCDGQCWNIKNSTPNGCIFNGTKYNFKDQWETAHCENCTCTQKSVECCVKYEVPMGFDQDCISIFDDKNCIFRIVRKEDPCQKCEVYTSVN